VMETTITFMPTAFDVAENDVRICGAIVDVDAATGRATAIKRVTYDERTIEQLAPARPEGVG
jgi:calcineurin-like phosphoesterase